MLASNETISTNQLFECEYCGEDKPASAFSDGCPDCDECSDKQCPDDYPENEMTDSDYDIWRDQCEKADRNGTDVDTEFDD